MKRPFWITSDELHKVPHRADVIVNGKIRDVGEVTTLRGQRVLPVKLEDTAGSLTVHIDQRFRKAVESALKAKSMIIVHGWFDKQTGSVFVDEGGLSFPVATGLKFRDCLAYNAAT